MVVLKTNKKLENSILYFLNNGGSNIGKKKLSKLLYFADFLAYEQRNKSITKVKYVKQSFGPMPSPQIFYPTLGMMAKKELINVLPKDPESKLEKIIPKEKPDITVFEKEEIEVLEQIAENYRFKTAGQLEKEAQSEPPYKMVNHEDIIPYHFALYRNSFGEMDLDE